MTDHDDPGRVPWDEGPAIQRVRRDCDAIVARVVAAIGEAVPFFRELPEEVVGGDVRQAVIGNVELVAGMLDTGQLPSQEHLDEISAAAEDRAEDGFPVEHIMDAFLVGTSEAWRIVTESDHNVDVEQVRRGGLLMLAYYRQVLPVVMSAYVEEARASSASLESGRQLFLRQLRDGLFDPEAARRAGLEEASGYLALEVRAPWPSAPDPEPQHVGAVAAQVTARRGARTVRLALRRRAPQALILALDGDRFTVLLPAEPTEDCADLIEDLRTGLESDLGQPIGLAYVSGAAADLPASLEQSHAMLEVAIRSGRPAASYALVDLALEVQMQQDSPVRGVLAARLAPLADRDDLLDTLRVHLACGLRRRDTAERLRLHPNSVDYRLRKIAELTGLDASDPAQIPTLVAALAALGATP